MPYFRRRVALFFENSSRLVIRHNTIDRRVKTLPIFLDYFSISTVFAKKAEAAINLKESVSKDGCNLTSRSSPRLNL